MKTAQAIMRYIKSRKILMLSVCSLIIIIAVLAVYNKTIDYTLIGGDDERLTIKLNNQYRSQGILEKIFTNRISADSERRFYRPLLVLSFYVDSKISGKDFSLSVSHTTNILLHIISVLLFFYFLMSCRFSAWQSLISSLIFALHPVISETTVWLAGRNDSILFIFLISSFISFIKYNERKKNYFLLIHAITYIAALLTKESAIVLPVICFLYMLIKKEQSKLKPLILWTIIAGIYFALRFFFLDFRGNLNIFSRFSDNLYMSADYLQTTFLMSKINNFSQISATVFIRGIIIVFILLFFGIRSKNKKEVLFAFICFSLFLIPNFFVERAHFQGNRMYVPLACLITGICFILKKLKTKPQNIIAVIISIIVITVCVARTNERIPLFRDGISFWRYEKSKSGEMWMENQYLIALRRDKQYDEIVKEFEFLVYEKKYDDAENIYKLAELYLLTGHPEKSDKILREFGLQPYQDKK